MTLYFSCLILLSPKGGRREKKENTQKKGKKTEKTRTETRSSRTPQDPEGFDIRYLTNTPTGGHITGF